LLYPERLPVKLSFEEFLRNRRDLPTSIISSELISSEKQTFWMQSRVSSTVFPQCRFTSANRILVHPLYREKEFVSMMQCLPSQCRYCSTACSTAKIHFSSGRLSINLPFGNLPLNRLTTLISQDYSGAEKGDSCAITSDSKKLESDPIILMSRTM
jgi:hypothetical protein